MITQIQQLIFKNKGMVPYEYRISMPINKDDDYIIVFVQWDKDDAWETFVLRIELHLA